MQLTITETDIEELEPIATATETARLQLAPPPIQETDDDAHIVRRLDRVARLCAAQIRSMDRSLVRIGKNVKRLVRHYDRECGLTALAARITRTYGKVVSRQYLGQALCVFESYTEGERENRFSLLTNTHLLKAAQGFPEAGERDTRNALLDLAAKDHVSVADLASRIKMHKGLNATDTGPESAPPTADAAVTNPRGYICGDGLDDLQALSPRSVSFLRLRESVAAGDAIPHAAQALSADGLMVVELSTFSEYRDVHNAIDDAASLRVLHTLIVLTPSIHHTAPHDLPITDCYRVIVLAGGYGFRCSGAQANIDNPMSTAVAEELICSLAPESGLAVDIGTGCAQTAKWAKTNGREFVAVEPDASVHQEELAALEAGSPC